MFVPKKYEYLFIYLFIYLYLIIGVLLYDFNIYILLYIICFVIIWYVKILIIVYYKKKRKTMIIPFITIKPFLDIYIKKYYIN